MIVSDFIPFGDDETPHLEFIAATNGLGGCAVIAMDNLVAVGTLRWWVGGDEEDPDNGRISYVYVGEQWRRKGIANAMFSVATTYADHNGIARPHDADERSPAGEAWAVAHGAAPATEVTEENTAWWSGA